MKSYKPYLRFVFAFLVIVPAGGVFVTNTSGILATTTGDSNTTGPEVHDPDALRAAENLTVVTAHYNDEKNGSLTVFTGDKDVVYKTTAHQRIFDVDPSPEGRYTVMYVGSKVRPKSACGLPMSSKLSCIRNVVQRVNLSTGTSKRVYTYDLVTRHGHDSIHDVDRINETHYLVADIFRNRVFIVNTSSNVITWEWRAHSEFPFSTGGPINDWTHLNDVEYLEDRNVVMADPRNHDQVWFIHRRQGLLKNWTLGEDDNHSVLYEQHNPDYIPAERGGPAVTIADSENNRIIEYQRQNGEWSRSWVWQDAKMEWPRDADRLPSGTTLITDTHSNRIFEVNEEGEIVWQVSVAKPYEAERLDTGDESTGGWSAKALGYSSVTADSIQQRNEGKGLQLGIIAALRSLIPSKLYHAVKWVVPAWVRLIDMIALAVTVTSLCCWIVSELYWTDRVRIRNPIRVEL